MLVVVVVVVVRADFGDGIDKYHFFLVVRNYGRKILDIKDSDIFDYILN